MKSFAASKHAVEYGFTGSNKKKELMMSSNHCHGKTKTGAPCRARAGADGLCFFHANPEQARALGQLGGRRNRQLPVDPNGGPLSAIDLRNVLAQAILDVQAKKLPPRRAGAIAQLSNTYCRLIPIADLEERVLRLEQYIAEHQPSVPNPDEAETKGTPTSPDEDTQEETEQGGPALPDPSQPVDMDTENGTQRRRRRTADGEEP